MGSPSDMKVMKDAVHLLKDWKIASELKVVSAHRSPEFMQEYSLKAKQRGLQVIIAGAGGAAHLPGMVASLTSLPVIGVPISLKKLKGLDSLLSIVQMPKGVPVSTVAIDNSYNAALLAIRILALQNKTLEKKLDIFQKKQKIKSLKSSTDLKKLL
ncbi:MAG: 5-(carboxyamino)imidazole ribonucleotide mutase [Bdellovibrionales bacterium]|nr:5-(carboxyamino)imidazole ribonucleotide mutase [Bdellovibrionales bacterium]